MNKVSTSTKVIVSGGNCIRRVSISVTIIVRVSSSYIVSPGNST